MKQAEIFNRSELLLGHEGMTALDGARVILFGVGGVGSWCAEGLIRAGLTHLTIVDSDRVCPTNLNRQLMATQSTIGQAKVEAMKARLLSINPNAKITALEAMYTEETAEEFRLGDYDYVIDCIDSLRDKCDLILRTTSLSRPTLLSSMGAALRIDPTKVRLTEFSKVQGDALARAVRNRFKKAKTWPRRKFLCVHSEEPAMENRTGGNIVQEELQFHKVQTNGSLCHITAIFGMMLAGEVIKRLTADS
ncbi:MAG: tRNA threonylcarbamoyladenosine dehydratase [Bacteroidaceae bacterium]|nr:tRNA threonylcarbamoyladenosine dehydratase [Bacteroidaceae bacterium]